MISSRSKHGSAGKEAERTLDRAESGASRNAHLSSTDDENSSVLPLSTPLAPTSAVAMDSDDGVKSALKEITSLLNTVVKRVERVESELKRNTSISSSCDSSPSHGSKKQYVPTVVRVSGT